jgi:DNA-binding IclR family transcriptional regulator
MSSLERLLSVLDLFTEERPIWSLENIIETHSFSRSMAYRYVKELSESGLLMPIGRGRFVLGPRIIELDRQIRVCDPLLAVGQPVMRDTIGMIGDGILTLSSLYGERIICTHQEPESSPLRVTHSRGRTLPLFSSSTSRAIVAHLPERKLVKLFLQHRPEISAAGLGHEWPEFKKQLSEIRRAGVCVSHGAIDPGVICAAVPLFNGNGAGNVIGAICLVQADRGQDISHDVSESLRAAAAEISEQVGKLLSQDVLKPLPQRAAGPFLANVRSLVDA